MGKVVKTVLVVAVAVAIVVFAPQIAGFIASSGVFGATVTAATMAALTSGLVGMGISLGLAAAASVFRKVPDMSQSMVDRLNASVVPTAPRKIVFGRTAAGMDIRFREEFDRPSSKKDGEAQVIALASHRINAVLEWYVEDEKSWDRNVTSKGGITGEHRDGIDSVRFVQEGSASNGISVGTGAKWTPSHRFTGCAYMAVHYKLDTDIWASGIPTRTTAIVEGCPLYDPRRDSQNGGSGSHRLADQSTYEWRSSNVEIGRNPALALLTYLLGWRIGGKVVWGMGVPASRIDFDNFRLYANLCEEHVLTQGGGSVQRYTADGIFSTGDTHETVMSALTAAMGSCKLTDVGGVYQLIGGYDDTLGPKIHFTDDDLIAAAGSASPYTWRPSPPARETYNIARGRFADPANLFQLVDWGSVEIDPIADGVPRTMSLDLGMVSRAETCQRIAKQFLLREAIAPGVFSAAFGPKAFAVTVGSLVTLSVAERGWNQKLFRVIEQAEAHDLIFMMTLREESSEIYAWDREEKPLPASIRPQGYKATDTIAPANLISTSSVLQGANGQQVSEVLVRWTPADSVRIVGINIESRLTGSVAWTEQAALHDPVAGEFRFSANAGGVNIEIRARYRMASGVYSQWVGSNVLSSSIEIIDGKARGDASTAVTAANAAANAVSNQDSKIAQLRLDNEAADGKIAGLLTTYGSTASAAASADAALQHKNNAEAAKANAELAKQGAEGAFNQTVTKAGEAQTFRNQASTFANTAQGYSSTASEQAGLSADARNLAGQYASAASGSASTANAKAGEAGQSANAAQSSSVTASNRAKDAASRASGNLVGKAAFSADADKGLWTGNLAVPRDNSQPGQPYVMGQYDRDAYEGDLVAGDWSNRRFRVSGNAAAFGAYQARAGLNVRHIDGSWGWLTVAVGGPSWGYADFSGEIVLPPTVVAVRPFLQSDGPAGASNHGVNWRTIRIEDITNQKAAQTYADAASSSYSNAQYEAGQAGQSASAASGHANTASIKSGQAAGSANAAAGSASTANEKAAAASSSATLAATFSTGGGNLLRNSTFSVGSEGWDIYAPLGGNLEWLRNGAGSDWQPFGEHNISIYQSDGNGDRWSQWHADRLAVEGQKWYEISAYLAAHRCNVELKIEWYDSGGTYVGTNWTGIAANFSGGGNGSGGRDINNWKRPWAKVQAPANAARAILVFVKHGTFGGNSNSWGWMVRPMLRQTYEQASGPSPYAPGSGSDTQSALSASISTTSTALATATDQLAQLKTVVQAGRPNLLKIGGFSRGMVGWNGTHGGWYPHVSGGWGQIAANSTQFDGYNYIDSERSPCFGGIAYTVAADSVYFLNGGSGHCYLELVWFRSDGSYITQNGGPGRPANHDFSNTDSGRNALCLTAVSPGDAAQVFVRLVAYKNGGSVNVIGWRQVKLEQADRMSAYSNEASVTNVAEVLTTVENDRNLLMAKAGITLDVNGYMTGWALNNNGSAGNMVINADHFAIVKPGGGARTEYSGGNWRCYDGNGTLRTRMGVW